MRHTAATWLVMEGVPLREVARLLGNSEAMVEKVYGKHSPDYLRRAVSALNLNKPESLRL
ncbi:MAG: integrase [Alphaproteobacteria bacterium]|nr:integrase [Alphaproteobacteria bacterium]